ncbi:MAG: HDOD domain-containing protein [Verrucomicrobiota bacterium]
MLNKQAKQTISCIESAIDADRTTAITEIIQIIQELASKAFTISVAELSQLIGRDVTITAKVISAANTLGFNPTGQAIYTISDAIHTVGFEKIRNLAISLLLVENAGHQQNTYEQRECAALSVCSGLMAQQFIERAHSAVNAELAFVCASLRNYGRLLMATFLVEKYRQARSLEAKIRNENEAFSHIFGITPLDLGLHLLQNSNLPAPILASLKEVPSKSLKRPCSSEEEEIVVLAEMSIQTCKVAFDEKVEPEDFNGKLMEVLEKFSRSIPIGLEMINESFIEIDQCMAILNKAIGVKDLTAPATAKIAARISGAPLPQRPPEAPIPTHIEPEPVISIHEMEEDQRESFAENRFKKAIDDIVKKIQPGVKVSLAEVFNEAAETITESLGLESCLVFVPEEHRRLSYSARYGKGPLFGKVKNRPIVSPKNRDIFSICLARKEDVLIQDISAGKISSVIPDWVTRFSKTNSCILLPAVSENGLFAIIFGCVAEDQSIQLKENDHRRLKVIRAHLSSLRKMIDNQVVRAIA